MQACYAGARSSFPRSFRLNLFPLLNILRISSLLSGLKNVLIDDVIVFFDKDGTAIKTESALVERSKVTGNAGRSKNHDKR